MQHARFWIYNAFRQIMLYACVLHLDNMISKDLKGFDPRNKLHKQMSLRRNVPKDHAADMYPWDLFYFLHMVLRIFPSYLAAHSSQCCCGLVHKTQCSPWQAVLF